MIAALLLKMRGSRIRPRCFQRRSENCGSKFGCAVGIGDQLNRGRNVDIRRPIADLSDKKIVLVQRQLGQEIVKGNRKLYR
jgi:hypothetical protein